MRNPLFITVACISVLLLAACDANLAGEPEIVATIPPLPTEVAAGLPAMAPDPERGALVYVQNNCAACHGINGAGIRQELEDGRVLQPPSLLDRENVVSDTPADYYDIITNGNIANLMPPWSQQLDAEERWAVALHNYTLRYSP
ncbi:MAG: cytochrome c, partial [Chloroflexota bacterium]